MPWRFDAIVPHLLLMICHTIAVSLLLGKLINYDNILAAGLPVPVVNIKILKVCGKGHPLQTHVCNLLKVMIKKTYLG